MKKRVPLNAAKLYVASLTEFCGNSSLAGLRVTPATVSFGYLPREFANELAERVRVGAVGYVVYSYGTPIAWRDDAREHWVIPDVKYSRTTSKHQTIVKGAVR